MNSYHHSERSDRYWKILVGEWFRRYIQIIYDRYLSLEKVLADYPRAWTLLLDERDYLYPQDNSEFLEWCYTDRYNLQLFSQILRELRKDFPSKKIQDEKKDHSISLKAVKSFVRSVIQNSRSYSLKSFTPIVLCSRTIPASTIKSFKGLDAAAYQDLLFIPYKSLSPVNHEARSHFALMSSIHPFEQVCLRMLRHSFPKAYLEDYQELKEQVGPFQEVPQLILSAVGWRLDVKFALWTAEAVERGARLLGLQHGGGYGIYQVDSMYDQEMDTVDRFVSWGWSYNEKTLGQPQPQLSQLKKIPAKKTDEIIFLSCAGSRYLNLMQSSPLSVQFRTYIDQQIRFFACLSKDFHPAFLIRPYPTDLGWNNRGLLAEKFPNLRFDDFKISFLNKVKNYRLAVIDNNQTSFLQTLALNIPTILFWNPAVWKIRAEAQPYFKALEAAQVWHSTPDSAAAFIEQNDHRLEEWWNSPAVRGAVEFFTKRFVLTSDNWLADWDQFLNNELKLQNIQNETNPNYTAARY